MPNIYENTPSPVNIEQADRPIERLEYGEVLGRSAVRAAEVATQSTMAESPDATAKEALFDQELEKARHDIATASKGEQKKFGKYLLSDGVPTWLFDNLGEANPVKLVGKLYEKDANEMYTVPTETFLNVLQWHSLRMEEKDQALEADVFGQMRERFTARLSGAVEQGWLAADVVGAAKLQRVKDTTIHLYDGIGPDKQFRMSSIGTATAYTHPERPSIVFRDTKHSKKNLERVFTHEMAHSLTGSTHSGTANRYDPWLGRVPKQAEPSYAGYGMARLNDRGDTFSENQGLSLLNEATTEHFAQALLGRDVEKVQPMSLNSSYRNGLRLLKALCEAGTEKISPALFINAMLEGDLSGQEGIRKTSDKMPHLTQLQESLRRAFPDANPVEAVSNLKTFGLLGGVTVKEMSGLIKDLRQPRL